MLKISKNSWHFKFVKFMTKHQWWRLEDVTSLCEYGREFLRAVLIFLIKAITMSIGVVLVAFAVALLTCASLYLAFLLPVLSILVSLGLIEFGQYTIFEGDPGAIYVLGWGFLGMWLIVVERLLFIKYSHKIPRVRNSEKAAKFSAIAAQYAKNLHDKTCTPVEFVD